MAASRPTPMLRAIDEAPLTPRYWILAISVMLGAVLEFFDFFLIAFVTPVVADEWDLTYGHAGAVLLGAGLGAILGSIVWGKLGDRYGRKRPLIAGILTFSLATGALAAAPEGGWWWLTLFRFVVGVGVGGVAAVAVPLIVEFTPTRVRSKLVGFLTTALIPIGVLLAGVVSAVFIPLIGWRPLFLIGTLPAGLAVFVYYYVRESPRWLLEQGRAEEAREVVAWILHRPEEEISAEAPAAASRPHGAASGYRSLLRYRRSFLTTSLSWFGAAAAVGGLVLWGPTFLETLLEIDADKAALLFVLVTLGSFTGRLTFSFAPQRFGRRVCGVAMGFGAAPLLLAAGLSGDARLGGVSVFLLFMIAAAFFADGDRKSVV